MCSWVKVLMHRSEQCRYTDRKNMAAALVSWNTMLSAQPSRRAPTNESAQLPRLDVAADFAVYPARDEAQI